MFNSASFRLPFRDPMRYAPRMRTSVVPNARLKTTFLTRRSVFYTKFVEFGGHYGFKTRRACRIYRLEHKYTLFGHYLRGGLWRLQISNE